MSRKSPRFVKELCSEYLGKTPDKFAENLSRLMEKASEFLRICDGDVAFSMDLLRVQDRQETRRIFVRTIPPYVEGSLNFLRILVYLYPPLLARLPGDCTVDFLEPMIELRNRTTAKDSIKRTLIGIGHVAGVSKSSDIMGELGAQALIATFELRDSLMHPRSLEGLIVTDAQIASARSGLQWFVAEFDSVFPPLRDVIKNS